MAIAGRVSIIMHYVIFIFFPVYFSLIASVIAVSRISEAI